MPYSRAELTKPIISLSLLFLSINCAEEKVFDAVIVGGGGSGLTAAYELRDYHTLIIEKENRLPRLARGSHQPDGNGRLLDELATKIRSQIILGATVLSVDDRGETVRVVLRTAKGEQTVVARSVIVATPAHVARAKELLADWNDDLRRASRRVFLAGDYLEGPREAYPGGLARALKSGRAAAERARQLIKPPCYHVDGICLQKIPGPQIIGFISRIKPKVFGLVGGGKRAVSWIDNIDKRVFGYDFVRFYGHKDFSFLMNIEVRHIDIIGYCPFGAEISREQFANRIGALKEKFKGRQILIGPCVDLFEKVINSREKPDVLGFELFEKNFDNYLNGEYDGLIEETFKHRTEVFNFPTFPPRVNLKKLDRVLERAALQKLKVGYTIKGSKRVLSFIESTQCKHQ